MDAMDSDERGLASVGSLDGWRQWKAKLT